ncbi:PIN domain-containing protein [Vibrio rotiferianus]|uniref:PIN domain-containing protein n=1 Tax=Vibrio rotiferianus TaxID=190895 RepID=UPI0038B2E38B
MTGSTQTIKPLELHSFSLGIPVAKLNNQIDYSTPRKPARFERLLLDLSVSKSELEDYLDMNLCELLEKVFCIPHPLKMVQEAFSNLIHLDLIEGYVYDFESMTLKELVLRENANSQFFQQNDELPSQVQSERLDLFYQPVSQIVTVNCETRNSTNIMLPDSVLGNSYPRELIESHLQSHASSYDWINEDSKIKEIIEREREIVYQPHAAQLIYHNRCLLLSSNEHENLNNTLQQLPVQDYAAVVAQAVDAYNGTRIQKLDTTLFQQKTIESDEDVKWFSQQELVAYETAVRIAEANAKKESKPQQGIVTIIDKQQSKLLPAPKGASLVIELDNTADREKLIWPEHQNQVIRVVLPMSELETGVQYIHGHLLKKTLRQQQAMLITLFDHSHGERSEYQFQGFSDQPTALDNPVLMKIISLLQLYAENNQSEENWALLQTFWIPADQLWQQWIDEPSGRVIRTRLELLLKRYDELKKLSPAMQAVHKQKSLLDWLKQQLTDDLPLSATRLELAINLAGKIIPESNDTQRNTFSLWLQENTQVPEDYQTLGEYERLLYSFTGQSIDSASSWFTLELLGGWLAACGDSGFKKLSSRIPLASAFNKVDAELITLQGEGFWEKLTSLADEPLELAKELVKHSEFEHLEKLFARYLKGYKQLMDLLTSYPLVESDALAKRIHQLILQSEKERQNPEFTLANVDSLFVADTSYLLNHLTFIENMAPSDALLLPRKAHEELNQLKEHKGTKKSQIKRKQKAQKVINAILEAGAGRVIAVDADVSLLPKEYSSDVADNLILSVALKYRNYTPTLLTDDKNLTLKAQSLDIKTLNSQQDKETQGE